jgi:putative RNase toxin 37 of polymorphic toxin system
MVTHARHAHHRLMRARLADQRGQTFVEWLAGCLVLVALAAGVTATAPPLAGAVGAGARSAICAVGAACGASGAEPRAVTASAPLPASPTAIPTPGPTPTPTSLPGSPTMAAGVPGPLPGPEPGPVPQPPGWRFPGSAGTHADRLPTSGDWPYSPSKEGRGKPVRVRGGGFKDEDGNIWEWAKGGAQHGGEHWDVQHPDKSHTNVAPDGTVIGEDNFPNRRREPTRPGDAEPDDGGGPDAGDAAKAVAVTGGVAVTLWWAGKLRSPACGPLMPVCAIVG